MLTASDFFDFNKAFAERYTFPQLSKITGVLFTSAEILHYSERVETMNNWLMRTELLYGAEAMEKLKNTKVAILGLGGVGSGVVEALARSGIGSFMLIDHDTVDVTNINRQMLATALNVGQKKTEAAKARILSINPEADIVTEDRFYLPDESEFLYDYAPDIVIDAIDTVTAKLHLAQKCHEKNIPLVMCLGTGNRTDPSKLTIGDIKDTANGSGCPLARVMRRELNKRGIKEQTVLYSLEAAKSVTVPGSENGRHSPGSGAFVPPVAGYLIAAHAVNNIILK